MSSDITIDNNGNAYVADTENHCIQKFDPKGNFLMKLGTDGITDGQIQSPMDISVDSSGNVYVVDKGNHRIQKFNSEG